MDGGFCFLSSFPNLPWLVGLRHGIPARAGEGICSSSVLQAQNQILFVEFNPLGWAGRAGAHGEGMGMDAGGEGMDVKGKGWM